MIGNDEIEKMFQLFLSENSGVPGFQGSRVPGFEVGRHHRDLAVRRECCMKRNKTCSITAALRVLYSHQRITNTKKF